MKATQISILNDEEYQKLAHYTFKSLSTKFIPCDMNLELNMALDVPLFFGRILVKDILIPAFTKETQEILPGGTMYNSLKNAYWIMTIEQPVEYVVNLVKSSLQKFLGRDNISISPVQEEGKKIQGVTVFLFSSLSKDLFRLKEDFNKLRADMKEQAKLPCPFQVIYCYAEEFGGIEELGKDVLDEALSGEPNMTIVATLKFPFFEMWKKKTGLDNLSANTCCELILKNRKQRDQNTELKKALKETSERNKGKQIKSTPL